jgi:hypothetical protein
MVDLARSLRQALPTCDGKEIIEVVAHDEPPKAGPRTPHHRVVLRPPAPWQPPGTVYTAGFLRPGACPPGPPPWRFEMLISPDVPASDRMTLARMRGWFNARFEGRGRSGPEPWPPGKVIAVVPAAASAVGAAAGAPAGLVFDLFFGMPPGPGTSLLGWMAGMATAGLAAGCLGAIGLVRRWQRQQTAERWSEYVVAEARQRNAARFPGVGERLVQLAHHVRRLREHPAVRGGWLPGVDGEALDRLHFTLAAELLNTIDLRAAVMAAANRPVLAAQVAARRAELAAGDAAFDAQLRHLAAMVAAADTIATRLTDLALAERLDAGLPSAAQVRQQLTVHAAVDLEGMAAAADEAVRIVGEALDPRRLYPARDPRWRVANERPPTEPRTDG